MVRKTFKKEEENGTVYLGKLRVRFYLKREKESASNFAERALNNLENRQSFFHAIGTIQETFQHKAVINQVSSLRY